MAQAAQLQAALLGHDRVRRSTELPLFKKKEKMLSPLIHSLLASRRPPPLQDGTQMKENAQSST